MSVPTPTAVPNAPAPAPVPDVEGVAKKSKGKKRNYQSYHSQVRGLLKDVLKSVPPTVNKEGKSETREAGFEVEAMAGMDCLIKDLTSRSAAWQREALTRMQSGGNSKKTLQPSEVRMSYQMILPYEMWSEVFAFGEKAVKSYEDYRAEQAKLKAAANPDGAKTNTVGADGKGRGKRKVAVAVESKVN